MTDDEMQRKMEFILNAQADLTARLEHLTVNMDHFALERAQRDIVIDQRQEFLLQSQAEMGERMEQGFQEMHQAINRLWQTRLM